MKKISTFILTILLFIPSFSQLSNLCGVWLGYNYQCFGSSGVQIIYIEHDADYTTATKIIGDNCVTDGQITWQGDYNQNPFPVSFTTGSSNSPGSSSAGGMINIIDSTLKLAM